MKHILLLVACCWCCQFLSAQNEPHYSHFMFNQLNVNPAYAGSRELIHFQGLYRNQWIGIDGAPKNFVFNFDTPLFNERTGLGISLISDQIGWSRNIYADISYAYRIKLSDKGKLSIGIKGRLDYSKLEWNAADPFDEGDVIVPLQDENSVKPNFGFGAFYYTDKFYVGLSAPTLLRTSLYEQKTDAEIRYRNKQSYYLNAGMTLGAGRNIKFRPSTMLTYNPSAPFEIDVNALFIFMDKFWLGAGARLGDSVDALVGYQLTRRLRASIAADFTTSQLREKSFGSLEVMLEYTFKCCGKKLNNLRYF